MVMPAGLTRREAGEQPLDAAMHVAETLLEACERGESEVLDALDAPFDWDPQIAGLEGVKLANDPLPQAMKIVVGENSGWMHMLASLKAYLEYGINLRAGGAL